MLILFQETWSGSRYHNNKWESWMEWWADSRKCSRRYHELRQCFRRYQEPSQWSVLKNFNLKILQCQKVFQKIFWPKRMFQKMLWHDPLDVPEEISTPEGVSDYVNIRKKWFKSRGRGCSRWYQDLSNRWILKRL